MLFYVVFVCRTKNLFQVFSDLGRFCVFGRSRYGSETESTFRFNDDIIPPVKNIGAGIKIIGLPLLLEFYSTILFISD